MNTNSKSYKMVDVLKILFYLYFTLMLLVKGFGLTDGIIYKYVFCIASFFALCKILLEKHSAMEWLFISILLLDALYVWYKTGNQGLFWTAFMCLSVKGISIPKAFFYGGWIWGSCFIIQICTHLFGIANFDYVVHNKWEMGHTIRWAMGYTHPNVMQISYAVLVMFFFYSSVRKDNFKKYVVFALLGWIYTFLYSLSLTGTIMLFVFLFLSGCQNSKHFKTCNQKMFMKIVGELTLPVAAIFSIVAPLTLQGKWFDLLNKLFQTRPYLSKTIFNMCGVRFFGIDYSHLGRNMTLDCSYMNLLIGGGIVGFLCVMALYVVCIHHLLWKVHDLWAQKDLIIILTVAVAAISEPFAFNTSFKNISLFIVGARIYQLFQEKRQYGLIDGDNHPYEMKTDILGAALLIKQENKSKKAAVITVIIGLILASLFYKDAPRASELYGSRRFFDDIEEYPELYLNEKDIIELEKNTDIRVLDYRGPKEPMVHFTENKMKHINQVEAVRSAVSAFVIYVLLVRIVCFIKRKDS